MLLAKFFGKGKGGGPAAIKDEAANSKLTTFKVANIRMILFDS
jgi:hypothetical protein